MLPAEHAAQVFVLFCWAEKKKILGKITFSLEVKQMKYSQSC